MTKATICHIGQISIHSYRMIEALSRRGYRTALSADSEAWIAPSFNKLMRINVLPALTRASFLKCSIPNNVRIFRILKRMRPDLVHLHAQHQYILGVGLSGFP